MYVGHLAIGLAIKSKFPKVPTLPIMLGVGFLDIIDGLLIMLGLNHVTPNLQAGPYLFFDLTFINWDHSLVMAVILSIVWALFFRKDKRVALIAGFACFSHWLADWPMHNMDLALYPYSAEHMGYGENGVLVHGFLRVCLALHSFFMHGETLAENIFPSYGQLSCWLSAFFNFLHGYRQ
ncbi:hypothetical protein [Acinetobacter sp. UBA6720]|uniref:hypothetical protein n=1 Tax=Acinetobacter sp. UBA6720 TaxID=1945953 RepID=UPI0025BE0FEA|nr:hypothetical protein [Acinetobacter sp. UBA6720]